MEESVPAPTDTSINRHHGRQNCKYCMQHTTPNTQTINSKLQIILSLQETTGGMPTAIEHIVLLKARPDVTPDDIERLVTGVNSLKSIPGIITITVGPTFVEEQWMSDRRDGYTHCLSCRLISKDALRVYQDHPLHAKVKTECIVPILAAPPVAVDYEAEIVFGDG